MFGKTLKRLRTERHLSIEALASKSGLTRQTIWNIEARDGEPRTSTLALLAKALEVETSIFFEQEDKCNLQKRRRPA